ncbi:dopamine beta hydroxylase [Penaeus vannamei]|uniref:Dopamine beta hydroxylase n=1 Tax=Penaeus vannamei TaxID=6689 RepID=A0A3R7Q437_PENVA|nr:dopamine beta hydroxylase [Penaeus vannamei]
MLPDHVGFPMGEAHGGSTYYLMEMHYDNPNLEKGVVDASGLRLFYTEKLRKFEAGSMVIGHGLFKHIIPPKANRWLSVGHCTADCTSEMLPAEGVKVVQALLHSHLLGREIYLRQIRDGKELPMAFSDRSYDFNYQQTRVLKDEITILPGDSFIAECVYDSSDRSDPSFGGFGTDEEMCLTYLTYYPRTNLSMCSSVPSMSVLLESFGIDEIYETGNILEKFVKKTQPDEEEEALLAEQMMSKNFTAKIEAIEISKLLYGIVAKAPQKRFNTSLYEILHDKATWQDNMLLEHFQKEGDRAYPSFGALEPEKPCGALEDEATQPVDIGEDNKRDADVVNAKDQPENADEVNGKDQPENASPAGRGMKENDKMMHRAVLDQRGDFVMLWTPKENNIIFEVQVATKGYVGLGFSPNGGMAGSDIVLGWVTDGGEVMVQDSYATGYSQPLKDDQQDVELLGGYQNDTHTVLRFSRPWSTCDEQDFELSSDTVRVIWAIGSEDPAGDLMRRHDHRGTKSLTLKGPQFTLPKFSEDVKHWDVLSPNVTIPNNLTTLYWCKLFKIPPITRKTHVIGYVPIVQEGNHQHVHHILFYECHLEDSARHYEKWLDVQGAQCYGANMPISWKKCTSPLVAWAIGGEGEVLPDNAGFPIGEEHGGATYFMMEIHYDNPDLKEGVVDASGIRIFHTENLREHDAGCTNKELPGSGVQVFQGLLHAHLLGRKLLLRQIRDGKELPIQLKDENYDFNYQQTRI